jgi:hypothetical protein
MTWGEWVDSVYNVRNFSKSVSKIYRHNGSDAVTTSPDGWVLPEDIIQTYYSYVTQGVN